MADVKNTKTPDAEKVDALLKVLRNNCVEEFQAEGIHIRLSPAAFLAETRKHQQATPDEDVRFMSSEG